MHWISSSAAIVAQKNLDETEHKKPWAKLPADGLASSPNCGRQPVVEKTFPVVGSNVRAVNSDVRVVLSDVRVVRSDGRFVNSDVRVVNSDVGAVPSDVPVRN